MSLHTSPLREDRIRLLKIVRQNPLLCALETFPFDETLPEYSCISYTWGSPVEGEGENDYQEKRRLTIVNSVPGGTVLSHYFVGMNLYKVLNQIHESFEFDIYIWVDAICINQQDVIEKSAEVQRMASIYTRSRLTIVWLGPYDEDYDALSEVWEWLAQACETWLVTHKHPPGIVWKDGVPTCESTGRTLTRDALQPLSKFFRERRYFRRNWVAQEFVLSKSLLIMYGGSIFKQSSFNLVINWIDHNASELVPEFSAVSTTEVFGPAVRTVSQLIGLRDAYHEGKGQLSKVSKQADCRKATSTNLRNGFGCSSVYTYKLALLEYTLWRLRRFEATDQRDHLFSLCGFVSVLDWLGADEGPLIEVDYAKSMEDVYCDFAKILIQNLPYLSVFAFLHPGDRDVSSRLPSYCPDWSKNPEFLRTFGMQSHAWSKPENVESFFDAYPTRTEPSCKVHFVREELHLFAVKCGIIEGHTVPFSPREKTRDDWATYWVHDYLLYWLRNARDFGPMYLQEFDIIQSLMENCLAGIPIHEGAETGDAYTIGFTGWIFSQLHTLELASRMQPDAFGRIWNDLAQLLDKLDGIGGLTTREELERLRSEPRDRQQNAHRSPEEARLSRKFELAMLNVISENNCYFNMTGGYIGAGPTTMMPGDEIWIPCRGRIPLVLRYVETLHAYKIIGEAYIQHGMRGELAQRRVTSIPRPIIII